MIWVQILASTTLALIPAYIVRCRLLVFCDQLSPIPLTLLEVLIVLTTIAWFSWRLSTLRKEKTSLLEPFKSLPRVIITAVGIFLLSGLISVFVSDDLRSAAGIFKAYFIEGALFGFIVYDLSKKKNSIQWLLAPFILSGVWVAAFAIFQQFTGQFIPPHEELRSRVSSVYSTSNAVGLYIGPLFFFTLGLILAKSKKIASLKNKSILFYFISALALLLAIIFSGSRGAFVATIAGLVFLGFYWYYLKSSSAFQGIVNRVFVLLVIIFIIGNALFIFNVSGSGKFLAGQKYFDTLTSRFCLWEKSKQMLTDKPIFGSGLSSFSIASEKYPVCKTDVAIYPHNIFLNFWLETGFIGLISFLSIVFIVWRGLSRSKSIVAGGVMAAIIYVFIQGMVDVPYFKNDLSTQFWVLLAVSLWLARTKKSIPV